ncbi:hypothetical protein HDV05_001898 [Chytridiales sp. JEL 0842]|nr:hypothetical protein HDV05_001898 [Chytridiales sp. JEL 0842]
MLSSPSTLPPLARPRISRAFINQLQAYIGPKTSQSHKVNREDVVKVAATSVHNKQETRQDYQDQNHTHLDSQDQQHPSGVYKQEDYQDYQKQDDQDQQALEQELPKSKAMNGEDVIQVAAASVQDKQEPKQDYQDQYHDHCDYQDQQKYQYEECQQEDYQDDHNNQAFEQEVIVEVDINAIVPDFQATDELDFDDYQQQSFPTSVSSDEPQQWGVPFEEEKPRPWWEVLGLSPDGSVSAKQSMKEEKGKEYWAAIKKKYAGLPKRRKVRSGEAFIHIQPAEVGEEAFTWVEEPVLKTESLIGSPVVAGAGSSSADMMKKEEVLPQASAVTAGSSKPTLNDTTPSSTLFNPLPTPPSQPTDTPTPPQPRREWIMHASDRMVSWVVMSPQPAPSADVWEETPILTSLNPSPPHLLEPTNPPTTSSPAPTQKSLSEINFGKVEEIIRVSVWDEPVGANGKIPLGTGKAVTKEELLKVLPKDLNKKVEMTTQREEKMIVRGVWRQEECVGGLFKEAEVEQESEPCLEEEKNRTVDEGYGGSDEC